MVSACVHAQMLIDVLTAKNVRGNRDKGKSLHELVKAIMWASGPIKRVALSGKESDTAQVLSCLHACTDFDTSADSKTCYEVIDCMR